MEDDYDFIIPEEAVKSMIIIKKDLFFTVSML